jgi:DNA-binding transcriptional regulator YiaG
MDAMRKKKRTDPFGLQMSRSMAELRSIMAAGQSSTKDGRLTTRTIEVAEPCAYDAQSIKKVRQTLKVSQAVLAGLMGVSNVLVRSWERGARQPAPIARRLLDQIRAHPNQFAKLIRPSLSKELARSRARPAPPTQTAPRSPKGKWAA